MGTLPKHILPGNRELLATALATLQGKHHCRSSLQAAAYFTASFLRGVKLQGLRCSGPASSPDQRAPGRVPGWRCRGRHAADMNMNKDMVFSSELPNFELKKQCTHLLVPSSCPNKAARSFQVHPANRKQVFWHCPSYVSRHRSCRYWFSAPSTNGSSCCCRNVRKAVSFGCAPAEAALLTLQQQQCIPATKQGCRMPPTTERLSLLSAKNRGSMAWKDSNDKPSRPVQTWGLHQHSTAQHKDTATTTCVNESMSASWENAASC